MRAAHVRRGRRRGAAMVEAVIVLPVFFILFVSVLYVHRLVTKKHDAMMEARSCAWIYSANDCVDVPPECIGKVEVVREGRTPDAALRNAMAEGSRRAEQAGDASGAIARVVRRAVQPALAAAFGKSLESHAAQEVRRPVLYGGGDGGVVGRYRLPCNLKKTTAHGIARDAWEEIVR